MATEKKYIGNGKSTKFDGVSVSIRLEDAQPHVRTTASGSWLTFIVAPKKQADDRGRTHNAFVLVEAQTPEPAVPVMAEPPAPLETPEGTKVKKGGRNLRRVSKAEAEARRAALADMKA